MKNNQEKLNLVWESLWKSLEEFSEDYMDTREQVEVQYREGLDKEDKEIL